MRQLSEYIVEATEQYNKKSMLSSASYLSDMGFWNRFFNQLIEELKFSKSHKLKSWDDLSKDEQSKVANFKKSLTI